ncbi:MAG TPA: DUF4184 family protein [Actinoplanes sp.]|nr:DUF4184 family protein [Actinoplanes sp.]
MPATIPSHQAAVLPLKVRFPSRFDGVALVIGSGAPDIGYLLGGVVEVPSHAWHSLLWFHVPVVVILTWLVRRAAPTAAAHLPGSLRDYGVLGTVRHPWAVTVASAMLGALTHQVWDAVTHPYMLFVSTSSWLPAMHATAFAALPWWRVVHLLSELFGVMVTVALVVRIARRRLLLAWHGPAPVRAARPFVFWPVAVSSAVALAVGSAALPGNDIGIWIVSARWLGAAALGVLIAAAVTSAARISTGAGAARPGRGA